MNVALRTLLSFTVFAPDAFVVQRCSVSCRAIPYTYFARPSSVIVNSAERVPRIQHSDYKL